MMRLAVAPRAAWRSGLLILGGFLMPGPMPAQTPRAAPVASPAVATITADALGRDLVALAADSLQVRQVPSPALERRARYIAAQFQQLGLQPGGDAGAWTQSFPVPGQQRADLAASQLRFLTYIGRGDTKIVNEAGNNSWREIDFPLAATARLLKPRDAVFPWGGLDQAVVVLAGRQTVAAVVQADLADKLVIYVPAADVTPTLRRQILDTLQTITHWVVVADDHDSTEFKRAAEQARQQPPALIDAYLHPAAGAKGLPWTVAVSPAALADCLAVAGLDMAQLRTAPAPLVQALPLAGMGLQMQAAKADRQAAQAMNVVGVLAGADPRLKEETLVFTGRLDDSVGSTAGLLALAQAFRAAQAQGRLRRSIAFVAVTEGVGQWGSRFFVSQHPAVPKPVLHLAVTTVGHETGRAASGDSVLITGAADLEFTSPLAWLPLSHPDVALTVVDSATAVTPALEDFPFVASGVPSLSVRPLRAGAGEGLRRASDVDLGRTASLLRLGYYLAETLANADRLPPWSARGRQRLTELVRP